MLHSLTLVQNSLLLQRIKRPSPIRQQLGSTRIYTSRRRLACMSRQCETPTLRLRCLYIRNINYVFVKQFDKSKALSFKITTNFFDILINDRQSPVDSRWRKEDISRQPYFILICLSIIIYIVYIVYVITLYVPIQENMSHLYFFLIGINTRY